MKPVHCFALVVFVVCLSGGLVETAMSTPVHNDFNTDDTSDLLLYNTLTGDTGVGVINAGALQSNNQILAADPTAGWILSASGDFDADGISDFLFYNTTTGELRVVLLDILALESDTVVITLPPASGLVPQGVGDIDGDGDSDILLFNSTTGEVVGLEMNGGTVADSGPITNVAVGDNWIFLHTGDFDGDGKTDLFLFNTVSGAMSFVPLNGLIPSAEVGLFNLDLAAGWTIDDVEDFNNDGNADLLMLNTIEGTLAVTLQDGAGNIVAGGSVLTIDVINGWTAANAGEYNGDGNMDVLLFNTVTGGVYILMLERTVPLGFLPVVQKDVAAGEIVHSGKP